MSAFADHQSILDTLDTPSADTKERLTNPSALRALHEGFAKDDEQTAANRAAIQELMDFVPPYDPAELAERGMSERFNVNFGLGASYKNEAVGAYLDIVTAPTSLVKIPLEEEVDPDMRGTWGSIMSEEWTKMIRSWDAWLPNMLMLADTFVSQGLGVTWFEDRSSMRFEACSLEDCKFPPDAQAVPSRIEAMTMERVFSISELYAKIEDKEQDKDIDGWNGPAIKRLIELARPADTLPPEWNYEAAARLVKSCRLSSARSLPSIRLVWGMIRELDGTISVYAVSAKGLDQPGSPVTHGEEEWVYRRRMAYEDANEFFQIFAFSVGNKNRIYTIRGLGYAIYEAAQADNILRCKMMDAARHRAGEIYHPESTIDSVEDIQFVDIGHAVIAPKGLRGQLSQNSVRMDQSIGYALDANQSVIQRHSAGFSSTLADKPGTRRNEMQVTAELEHLNKMTGFAVSLFYTPYDNLLRELVRRAFQETQSDLVCQSLVNRMKEACESRGVPRDIFGKIDLRGVQGTRLTGAGSKGSRIISFQQASQLFPEMDEQGQEFFNFDFASEILDAERAVRYFGLPGERRGHVDEALAQLENNDLLEGQFVEPVDGENKMVHLRVHLAALVEGLDDVNQGAVELSEWTTRHIPLYSHVASTLEATSVHESRIQELNSYRQQVQQVGEVIENGMRHLNKLRKQEQEAAMAAGQAPAPQVDENGNPIAPQEGAPPAQAQGPSSDASASQMDNDMKLRGKLAEAQAKIEMMGMQSQAAIDIKKSESMAKIALMDAETAAKIRRQSVLEKAKLR
jgi:hypothetical protein